MQTIYRAAVSTEDLDRLTAALLSLPVSSATNALVSVVDQLRVGDVAFFTQLDELTPNQAAPLLGVSRPTVCKLVDTGELPARVVGRRDRRIPMAAITRYLEREGHAARGERVA